MKEKHILICISDASDYQKLIAAAKDFSRAIQAQISAIVAEDYGFHDNEIMSQNMELLQSNGIRIITAGTKDFSLQAAEYARISGVTHILLQEDLSWRFVFQQNKKLSVQLSDLTANVEILIVAQQKMTEKHRVVNDFSKEKFSVGDLLKMLVVLLGCTAVGYLFLLLGLSDVNVIMVYLIGVLLIAMMTNGRSYSLVSSILSVMIFNFFFTSPYFTLMSDRKNIATFLVMFLAALLQSSLTVRIKTQVLESSQKAYRTEVLLESSQVISQAEGVEGVLEACANQLNKLLEKDLLMAEVNEKDEVQPSLYFPFGKYEMESSLDKESVQCAIERRQVCGSTTNWCPESELMVWPIIRGQKVLALCGIDLKHQALNVFEKNLTASILEQCAMVLETQRALKLKQEIEENARQEALRANLLRMISHDLRTPLTAISGNALLLKDARNKINEKKLMELAQSIHEDAKWLIQLVENLLSITRIDEGKMKIHFESELVEEVIQEALNHVDSDLAKHPLSIHIEDELLMAKMDAGLIVQVLINLVNNAIKHTDPGSLIQITAFQRKSEIVVQVKDNGKGISKEKQKHLFEMFNTLDNLSGDSRRGMGLGLALCRSIIHAHNGSIVMYENEPCGSVFEFTLEASEVNKYE